MGGAIYFTGIRRSKTGTINPHQHKKEDENNT
jgi:hypothetical protein